MPYSKDTAYFLAAILFSAIVAIGQTAKPRRPAEGQNQQDILFVQAASLKAGRFAERYPQGSKLVRLAKTDSTPVNLTPNFFAAASPRVSFDGTTVLFAGKTDAAGAWQIWEMGVDGSGLRQLSHCNGNCFSPAWLPRDEIAFTGESQDAQGNSACQIYVGKRDGSNAFPITFGPGDYELETVLQNGLILVSARTPLRAKDEADGSRNFYTVRTDGTGLASFRCAHGQPAVRSQAAELDNGSVVFVKNGIHGPEVGGELAEIERGALHNSPLGPSNEIIWSPTQLETKKLVVSRRIPSSGSEGRFDLYSYDLSRSVYQGPIYKDSGLSSVEAVPIASHPVPRWYWSTLNPKVPAGYFICLDASLTSGVSQNRMSRKPSKVRVLILEAASKERCLGEAPVEADGSFYIAVPPDSPVRFELLDSDGKTIHAQQSWIWARRGDERGCVGCHEDHAVAPPNRWPLALRRFDTPTAMGVELRPAAAH